MPEIDKGLERSIVAETRLSGIDGEGGELTIGGFPLAALAPNATFEEVAFLLWNDSLPTIDELRSFRADLAERRSVAPATRDAVRAAAEDGLPAMDALRMGAASANLEAGGDDPEAVARDLVAKFPAIVAGYWRAREGEDPLDPRPDLGHAANYLYMLSGEEPSEARVRGLETYLNTVVDHGMNASTFTARVITSTESDLVSAVTGAVGALKGPLHGGAPGPVLEMLLDIRDAGDPEAYLADAVESGERLMGFGHRVYRVRDPRAAVLEAAAERFYAEDGDDDFLDLARDVEDAAVSVLAEEKPGRDLETNVEFYTALLLYGVGVPRDLFSATFAVSRVAGWTAHCLEQRADNRLIRPRATYVGETGREWVPPEGR